MLVLTGGPGASAGDSPTVVLRAAAAQGKSGIEVRLRWSLTDGWLPDGGFNLYRSDRPAPLNAMPLGANASAGSNAQINIGAAHLFQLGKLLSRAHATPTSTLPPLAEVQARPASAQADFDRLAPHPATAVPPAPDTPASTAAAQTMPLVTAHIASKIATAPPSTFETTLASRRALLLGAALHPAISNALGLSFDDSNVSPGQTYTYTLRPIRNGTEGPAVATVSVTVPKDTSELKPAAPTGLRAIQTGADTVALRWERLSSQTEAEMGVAKYDVFRRRENSKLEKLNDVPVMVVNVGTPGAQGAVTNLHEPKAFFTDTAPLLGRVEYQIVVTDIFDRSSEPAQVLLNVADLRPPREVPFAGAQLQTVPSLASRETYRRSKPFNISPRPAPAQPVLVAWQPSPDSGVAYRVYRADTEQPGQAPQLLTPTAVAGATTAATALPAGSIADALATEKCSSLAHAGNLSSLVISQNSGQSLSPSRHGISISNCNLSQLSASDRAQVEQTLLSSLEVLTWVDSTAQKDHYYRYYVASVFARNSVQATPVQSNVVAYPDLTPPATPAGASATFEPATPSQPAGGQETSSADQSGSNGRTAGKQQPFAGGKSGRHLTLADWKGPLVKAPPHDTGGTMSLKWQASAGAARYEVYRAILTRITLPANASQHRSGGACASSPSNAQSSGPSQAGGVSSQGAGVATATATVNGHLTGPSMAMCFSVPALASITWQVPPKDSDFVLLGTARTTEYDDALSRSSAQYYQYRIVPVNRWNVPGPMVTIDARAPATQPPGPPKLLVGSPSPDGGAQIEFLPDADPGEEVIRYELWRSKLLPSGAGASDAPASAGGPSGKTQEPSIKARIVHASSGGAASSAPSQTHTASTTSGHTSSLSSNKLQRIALGPASPQLAGAAGRYGVTLHEPALAAVSRNGFSMVAAMETSILQGQKVAQVNSTDLPAGSNTGAWLADGPSSLDWRNDYVYVVKAIDKDGLVSTSDPVDVTPLKVKAGLPASVAASLNSRTCAVDVTWQSTDPDTAGFVVERQLLTPSSAASPVSNSSGPAMTANGPNAGVSSVYYGSAGITAPSILNGADYVQLSQMIPAARYTDSSVFPDNSYLYRVRTIDKAGNVSAPAAAAHSIAVPDGCGATASVPPVENPHQQDGATQPPQAPVTSNSPQAPRVSAGVASPTIPIKGVTTLSFRIENTTGAAMTGIRLTSSLPAGLIVALPNALANSCGGTASAPAWMNSISLVGVALTPGTSCVISVNVTGTAVGPKQVNGVLSYSAGTPITSSGATITVAPAEPTPANPPKPPAQPTPAQPVHRRVVPA